MRTSRLFLLVSLALCFHFSSYAQSEQQKIALRDFLISAEKHFNITFTYADENIEGISIIVAPFTTIEELILHIKKQTDLEVEKISETYFTINSANNSDKVCGYLYDIESKEPIVNAVIRNGNKYTLTNNDGYFELNEIESKEPIVFQSMGYNPSRMAVRNFSHNTCESIFLQPNILTLPEIIINDYLVEGINKLVDGTFLIHPDYLGILPGLIEQDVLETVQALPGINSVQEKVADINVRAGSNDQNLVLWDGIRMYQYGHFFGLISAFNPYLTEEVRLIKNGTPASLSDGISSTIEIISSDNIPERLTGGVGLNFIDADMFLKIPVSRKFSMQISARRSIADIIATPTYQNYYDRAFRNTEVISSTINEGQTSVNTDENFIFFDVNARIIYNPTQKDQFRGSISRYENNLEFRENVLLNDSAISKMSNLKQKNTALGLSYYRKWNDRISTSVMGYFTKYELSSINHDINNDQRLIQENEVIDDGLKTNIKIALKDHLVLEGGYHFTEVGIENLEDINNPIYYRLIKKVLRTHSIFSEVEFNSTNDKTYFRAGLRANYFQKFNLVSIEPRFAFNQFISERLSLEVLGEIKSQTSTQEVDLQNDFLGVENRRWKLFDNKEIPLLKNHQISLGLNYHQSSFLLSAEVFYKKAIGITSKSQGFQNQFQYKNEIGDYTSFGSDILISQQFKALKAWAGYSISKNDYTFPGFSPSEFASNFDMRHAITSAISYTINGFEFSTGIKWHTGIPYTPLQQGSEVDNGKINFSTPNSARLNDYIRWDVSTKYSFHLSDFTRIILGVSIWNLTNHNNIVNQYYKLNEEQQLTLIQQSSLGLTPNVSIRLHF